MPDGICVFRSSITVKIAYDGYYVEACGIDIRHADCEPGEKNSPLTVSVGRGTSGSLLTLVLTFRPRETVWLWFTEPELAALSIQPALMFVLTFKPRATV